MTNCSINERKVILDFCQGNRNWAAVARNSHPRNQRVTASSSALRHLLCLFRRQVKRWFPEGDGRIQRLFLSTDLSLCIICMSLFLVMWEKIPKLPLLCLVCFSNAGLPVQMGANQSTLLEYCNEEGAGLSTGTQGPTPQMLLILPGTHCTSQMWVRDSYS